MEQVMPGSLVYTIYPNNEMVVPAAGDHTAAAGGWVHGEHVRAARGGVG